MIRPPYEGPRSKAECGASEEAELNRQHACSFGGGGIVRAPGVARAHSSARRQGPEPCEVVTSLSVALREQLAKAARVQAPQGAGLGDGLSELFRRRRSEHFKEDREHPPSG